MFNRIRKVSKKKSKEDRQYTELRKEFLTEHPMCQACISNCTSSATDVHHKYFGKDRSKYYLDISTWMAICRNCHSYIHDKLSSEDALELGFKLKD